MKQELDCGRYTRAGTRPLFSPPACAGHAGAVQRPGEYEATLVHETAERGVHTLIWNSRSDDAGPLARGVYFLRLEGGGQSLARKVVLTH